MNMFVKSSAIVATAAVATAAPALAKPAAADPVIALAVEVENAYAADIAACDAYSPLDDAHIEWLKKNPMPKFSLPQQAHFKRCAVTGATIVEGLVEIDIFQHEQRATEKRALANWKRRERRWKIKSGYTAAEQAGKEIGARLMEALDALADAVPTTLAGLIAKARAARTVGEVLADDRITPTFPRDIAALALAFGEA